MGVEESLEKRGWEEIAPKAETIEALVHRVTKKLIERSEAIRAAVAIADSSAQIVVTDENSRLSNGLKLAAIRAGLAEVDFVLQPVTGQLKAGRNAILFHTNPLKEKLEASSKAYSAALVQYVERINAVREAERIEAESNPQAAASDGAPPLDGWVAPVKTTVNLGHSTLFERKDWDVEVTDEAAVPVRLKVVDLRAAMSEWKAKKEDIPGLRFFQKTSIVTRKKGA